MSEPRIVTPYEAKSALAYWKEHGRSGGSWGREEDAAYTIATEPDRIRALIEQAQPERGIALFFGCGMFVIACICKAMLAIWENCRRES